MTSRESTSEALKSGQRTYWLGSFAKVAIVAFLATTFFMVTVVMHKSPAERQMEQFTPITLTAQINGKGELRDLQALVDGKSVTCHSSDLRRGPVWCDVPLGYGVAK